MCSEGIILSVLYDFVKGLLNVYTYKAEQKEVVLGLEYSVAKNLRPHLDQDKIAKILNNLISNALKFTTKGDKITLKIDIKGASLIFEVKDTGQGIYEEDLPHIFDRFYQSKRAAQSLNGGIGIGLALSKELTELMEGELKVKSKFGEGSCFTLTLPLKLEDTLSISMSKDSLQANGLDSSAHKIRLLLVEDHHDMRKFIAELLSRHFEVEEARNGLEALKILEKAPNAYQILVSDIMMPEMDGITLLNRVKKTPAFAHLAIIMLTAKSRDKDKLATLKMGVDDYIVKPFSSEELLVRVQNIAQNYMQRAAWKLEEKDSLSPSVETDSEWLAKVKKMIMPNLQESDFSVKELASMLQVSERQLFRKIKTETGLTPNQFIHELRLQKARNILESGSFETIKEVCYEVGYKTPHYFSQKYYSRFGKMPKEYKE